MFGLHLLQANMSGNIYSKFLINGLIGLPGNLLAVITMRRYVQKLTAEKIKFKRNSKA